MIAGAVLGLVLAGCARRDEPSAAASPTPGRPPPPRYRAEGPRLPTFTGRDPARRGWVKVDDLLWIEARDAEAYHAGRVFDGRTYVPLDQALGDGVPAREGFRLRTDHVALATNLPWERAKGVACAAEAHVARLVGEYGTALALRLPADPLPLVVSSRRAEFEATLRGLVASPVEWGAFYDAESGVVYVCAEPARRGPLPWQADLRHEMTHQILDLSRPPARRTRTIGPPWFWLWEGIAIWSEGLGDPPGTDTGADRIARFQRRYAWNEWTPLQTLFDLPQTQFEGRHYDQVASLMRFLMDPASPDRRGAVLDLVRRRLAGPIDGSLLADAVGMDVAALEARWRATVGR